MNFEFCNKQCFLKKKYFERTESPKFEIFVEIDKEADLMGRKVSEEKTKYRTLDWRHGSRNGQNITIDEHNFEVVR